MSDIQEAQKNFEPASEASAASNRLAEEVLSMPNRASEDDKVMENVANTVYDRIAQWYNSSDSEFSLKDSHQHLDWAMKTGRLDELVDKINEKIWSPDGVHHLNLRVEDGPRMGHAINKRVILSHEHTGKEVSHHDVHKMISDPIFR